MAIVEVFARNLSALMDARIDSVEKVARAFRLRACDILDPDLVKRLAANQPLRMPEPTPPVMSPEEWKQLPALARAFVEDFCNAAARGLDPKAVRTLHDVLAHMQPPAAHARVDPLHQAVVDRELAEAQERKRMQEEEQQHGKGRQQRHPASRR
jgi:hypothetical protein